MHVVITGASAGIGRALALEYGRAGATLTLIARRRDRLNDLAREVGRPCHLVVHDLSVLEAVAHWIPAAEEVNGPIDVLVNNAGLLEVGSTAAMPVEDGQRMIDLCSSAPLRLSRAVLPGMLARGGGTIVQLASVASFVPPPGGTWYGAAKAGLAAFSENLRSELRDSGVHVLTVYPGPVDTALADGAVAAYEKSRIIDALPMGTPGELARRIVRAVEKRRPRLVYPRPYWVTRFFPGVFKWITEKFQPPLKARAFEVVTVSVPAAQAMAQKVAP